MLTEDRFAHAQGMKRQLGYLIFMVDGKNNCNAVHYGSNKLKDIARSVMEAEIQALVLGFDLQILVKDLIEEKHGQKIKLCLNFDRKTVFNAVEKDSQNSENGSR